MEVLYSSGQKRRERNTCDRMDIVANLAVAVDSVGCRNKIIAFLPELGGSQQRGSGGWHV
jgi:hypothetical protein